MGDAMELSLTEKQMTDAIIAHGIRPSLQRVLIYSYLCKNPIHPTVDTVYTALMPSIPTLSKTTVYNTLKLFCQHNLVQTLTIENDELRYDADLKDHLHFKCTHCGQVYDIPYTKTTETYDTFKNQLPGHFIASKVQACIWGTCAHCNHDTV